MRSNGAIGPPIELMLYRRNSLILDCYRKFTSGDAELQTIHGHWEQSLRRAVEDLPDLHFASAPIEETTQTLLI
jgi:putative proteasome-type protease